MAPKAEPRKRCYDRTLQPQYKESEVNCSDKVLKGCELLKFSLSKNSGRVSVHSADGSPLCVNFDIEDTIEEKTAENLLQQRAKRTKVQCLLVIPKSEVSFNHQAIEEGMKCVTETIHLCPFPKFLYNSFLSLFALNSC